jgi:RNA polymerase sigma-70 factor (ECF subfamily)
MTVHERVEQIYATERKSIYSYLLLLGVPPERAQELAQDSFLKLYLRMTQGERIENPRAWLYRVAHNLALKWHEREPVFDVLDPAFGAREPAPDPECALLDMERQTALTAAIRELSPQQKHCLHLRLQGLRYREIAEVVGIGNSAVGEFLRRAVARLKEALHGF